jgi:hypothetical protein
MQKARDLLLGYDPTFVDFTSNAEAGPDMPPVFEGGADLDEDSDDTFRDFNALLRQYVGTYGGNALVMQLDDAVARGGGYAYSDSDSEDDQALNLGDFVVEGGDVEGAVVFEDAVVVDDVASAPDTPTGEDEVVVNGGSNDIFVVGDAVVSGGAEPGSLADDSAPGSLATFVVGA